LFKKCGRKNISQEEFIKRAILIHGNKYDYSKAEYVHSHSKLIIICPIHGEFEQAAYNHLKGCCCPKCNHDKQSIDRKSNTEEFIAKARLIHGDKYDYSKVVYINNRVKVTIICPIHGEFEQRPSHHLRPQICPKCSYKEKSLLYTFTLEEWIKKAREIHGDIYDYSKVVYISAHDKVTIICPIHGEFEQLPFVHLDGSGCRECFYNKSRLTLEEFLIRAKAIHGDRYDYNKVKYINSWIKVIIICPVHGEFLQSPVHHLQEKGCFKCASEKRGKSYALTTEEFIAKSRAIHGNKYDYNKVEYINNHTKIIIICPVHGEFEQKPNSHLRGNGCPICSSSKGELAIKAILENHNIKHIQQYNIPEVANRLSYDFYLPDYNILIEFHGKQHFEYIPYFHRTEDGFLSQKNRDDMVRSNAIQFKYRYLEFNYKQLKELSKEQFEELIKNSIDKYKKCYN